MNGPINHIGKRLTVGMALLWVLGTGIGVILTPSEMIAEAVAAEGGFDYSDYAYILRTYVDNLGLVSYKELKADRKRLDAFTEAVGKLDPNVYEKWSDKEKTAFLINAYNALTLKLIIDHYPIQWSFAKSLIYPRESIRQIDGAWDKIEFPFMRGKIALDGIEHGILRKKFNEPRIHMALVCAAISCPYLRTEPYTAEKLDEQLDDQSKRFVSHPFQFRIVRTNNRVYLSAIFKWYGEDFVKIYGTDKKFTDYKKDQRAVLNFISKYLSPEDAAFLEKGEAWLEYRQYNWGLNEKTKENESLATYGFPK